VSGHWEDEGEKWEKEEKEEEGGGGIRTKSYIDGTFKAILLWLR